jgi:hypothetical protein
MKRILFIFSLLTTLSPQLFASTNVGASLSENTQWDQSGSPYIVQSRVLVPPGVTLKIGSGVQVVFQGPATLQISGELKIEGSAAAPAVINMINGGLRSALFIDGGEAYFSNMKVLGGVFLARDATVRMDGCEVTKGSGLYLKGNAVAHLRNNKFYGNATGVVLDGPVEADMQFNTLVQNTYGLYLKDFSKLTFLNNSIHDNDSDVVNNGSKAKLGGNYWGTLNPQTAKNKIKGSVSISPMKDIKDILRAYLRSELPVITKVMSDQAEKEDERAEKAAKEALREFRTKQQEAEISVIQTTNKTPTPLPTATPIPIATPVPTATTEPTSDLLVPPPSAESVPPSVPTAAPAPGAPSAPSDLGADIPMPPSSSSNAPEPPALGDLAASAAAPSPSPLPSEQNTIPTDTPTPADTSMELSPAPSDLTDSMTEPMAISSPVSQQPAPGDLTSTGEETPPPTLGVGTATSNDLTSIVATAQAVSSTPTTIPTIALPDLGSNSDLTNPPAISSSAVNDTATFTSTPVVLISTPTPSVSNASSAASPASGSLVPMAPNAVPPPPDFGDSSNMTDTQPPPALPNSNAAPLPPPSTSDQSPKATSSPTDVDGMQAPPMDSGLDFAAPQK